MSPLRRSLVALTAVALLALMAVWQVPQWLDWTRYRSTIEVLASATLGQPVTIQGPITLTLLPEPVLTAAQVNVGGTGATDMSIHVDALRLRVALGPLLRGRVDARELVLRGADLRILWPGEPGRLLARPPAWLAAFTARIENGRLTIGRVAFTGIDATLATLETGALSATGTAQFSGHAWHVVARLTAAGGDGAAGLNVALDGQGEANGLGASFSGQLASDGTLAGEITSRGPNLAVLLPAPPVPFRADGRLTIASGLAAIDELALQIGGSPASGAVSLRVSPQQRLDIALSASRLDLDAWLPVLLGAGTTIAGIDVPIGLDFSAEAAPLAGGTLEHLRAAFELTGNSLTVRDASVLLPGNGMLQLTGRVARDDPAHARFEGEAKLAAPVLRTTLRWLQDVSAGVLPAALVAGLPDGVLQRAGVTAHVIVGAGMVSLQQLAGSLDDAPLTGSISFRRGEPPSITADLRFDRLALEPWLPMKLPTPGDLTRLAGIVDADLRLGIRQASLAGASIQGVSIDAAMEAGNFALRRVEGMVTGLHVVASGSIGHDGQMSDGALNLVTQDAAPLAALMPAAWRAMPALWNGPAKLDIQAAGPPNALALGIELSLADARLDAEPTIDLHSGAWHGTLVLRHPGARRFLATFGIPQRLGLPELPAWLGDGSLSLQAHLAGVPGRLSAESVDVTAAALRATGKLALDNTGDVPQLSGHVQVDTLPLPQINAMSEVSLPIDLLHGWHGDVRMGVSQVLAGSQAVLRDATCSIMVAANALRIDRFSSKLGDGTLTGSFAFDGASEPPSLAVQVRVTNARITGALADAPLDLLAGVVSGGFDLAASGYSPAAILATLGGHFTLNATNGTLDGFDLFRAKRAAENRDSVAAQSVASDALTVGATAFDRLDVAASIAHGGLTFDAAQLHGVAGDAVLTGSVNLATQMLDLNVALLPSVPHPPEIAVHLTGPLEHSVRTPELANFARFVADRAR